MAEVSASLYGQREVIMATISFLIVVLVQCAKILISDHYCPIPGLPPLRLGSFTLSSWAIPVGILLGSLSPWTGSQRCSFSHFYRILLVEIFEMVTINRRALFLANWVQFWKLGLISGKIEISEKTSSTNLWYVLLSHQQTRAIGSIHIQQRQKLKQAEKTDWSSQVMIANIVLLNLVTWLYSQHSEAPSELSTSPSHKLFRLWALVIALRCNKSEAILLNK